MPQLNRTLCIAPMLDWTDRHYRYFMRLISKRCMLYTEMINAKAILHGDPHRFLDYSECENPLTLQLGGNDPKELSQCAKIAESWGYDEVNLNVGCPSDRVQSGAFGLCLMKTPHIVADCIKAMKDAADIPISIKCRIGYDNEDSYEALHNFIQTAVDAQVDFICIHARKGWLNGLSPKENRTIPELNYQTVYDIKKDFPNTPIGINGGIESLGQATEHLKQVDSVMVGRAAYHDPYSLIETDTRLYNDQSAPLSRLDIIENMIAYIESRLKNGVRLNHMTRHVLGLFQGQPGARAFRRYISENATQKNAGPEVLKEAVKFISSSGSD
ncbi:tRNA dihydrouridine(20/20a) synthase DusA [Francisellaceae bacterium]|nr:tRNA dihydrouridine(20/20a) synthase DusA [Francisellaceae bacterium]